MRASNVPRGPWALIVAAALVSGCAEAAEPRVISVIPADGGWQVTVEGVAAPQFRLDGQAIAARRADGAGVGSWVLSAGATGPADRLVVGDGKRDVLSLQIGSDDPAEAPFNDWTIYHVMLAYFANGDVRNDRSGLRRWVHPNYAGGDLQGVLGRVEYLKSLGVNAVWLSPLFASETSHGYDVLSYFRIGDAVSVPSDRDAAMQLYHRTVDALHAAGIRVILDVPLNHASGRYERREGDPKQLKPKSTSARQEAEKVWDSWNAGFRYWNFADAGTREFLIDVGRYWLTEGKADGLRLDYVRGVPHDFWAAFYAAMKAAKPDAFLFGEAWQDAAAPGPNAEDIATYYSAVPDVGAQFDGLIEFPLQMVMTDVFARGARSAADIEYWLQRTAGLYGPHGRPVHFLDNHDMSRFLAWAGDRGHERVLAAIAFMASLSSPMVVYYGTETGISGGLAEPGFNDSNRIPMPWNALDTKLIARVSEILKARARLPAMTRGGRLPVYSDDVVLVMRKVHPSGDVLVGVNLGGDARTVRLPVGAVDDATKEWTTAFGDSVPRRAVDGSIQWTLPPLSTSWASAVSHN